MKPKVILNCVANHYTSPDERIVEFDHPNGGGLISFTALADGTLRVEVYRCDKTVKVVGPTPEMFPIGH